MSELSLDYIAGFFDGEGSVVVGIVKQESNYRWGMGIRPMITISQKDTRILERIKEKLGIDGRIIEQEDRISSLRFEKSDSILKFIKLFGDKLILKRKQLEILRKIEMLRKGDGAYRKKSTMLKILDLVEQLHILNNHPTKIKYDVAKVKEMVKASPNKWLEEKIDKQTLFEAYWNKKLTPRIIAKDLGVSTDAIYKLMQRYGIPRRGYSEAGKVAYEMNRFGGKSK